MQLACAAAQELDCASSRASRVVGATQPLLARSLACLPGPGAGGAVLPGGKAGAVPTVGGALGTGEGDRAGVTGTGEAVAAGGGGRTDGPGAEHCSRLAKALA